MIATLIAFAGLPGVGKSSIARALCQRSKAVYLRVDEVEAALKRSSLRIHPAEEAGYLALAAIATSNLRLGQDVVTDTVNPVAASRDLWAETARTCSARILNVEVVCTDEAEHRRRVETRGSDIDALVPPSWEQVRQRDYEPWAEPPLRLDSASLSIDHAVDAILQELAGKTA